MIRNVHHLGILVDDVDKMIKFYRDAFGFEFAREIDAEKLASAATFKNDAAASKPRPRAVMLRTGNCYMEIIENLEDRGATSKRKSIHFSIEVENVEDEYRRLEKLGVKFFQSAPFDLGYVKAATGIDPEGNHIEISEYTKESGRSISK